MEVGKRGRMSRAVSDGEAEQAERLLDEEVGKCGGDGPTYLESGVRGSAPAPRSPCTRLVHG